MILFGDSILQGFFAAQSSRQTRRLHGYPAGREQDRQDFDSQAEGLGGHEAAAPEIDPELLRVVCFDSRALGGPQLVESEKRPRSLWASRAGIFDKQTSWTKAYLGLDRSEPFRF